MSGSDTTADEIDAPTGDVDVDLDQYTTMDGVTPTEFDGAPSDHDLKQALGDADSRSFKFDSTITGKRFAERYDRMDAWLREYIANAETGTIRRARHELLEAMEAGEIDFEDAGLDAERAQAVGYEQYVFEELEDGDILELTGSVFDYRPVIEVVHSHPESTLPAVIISDNGIGISIEEYVVLEHIGKSASVDDGKLLGQKGQGVLSGFVGVSEYGAIEMTTRSYLDEANYSIEMHIDGPVDIAGTREGYGVTWRFPRLAERVRESVDIRESIETYTSGLRVPLLYREFNATGEEVFNEDYSPTTLREGFEDTTPVVVYEDDCVEVVMSPAIHPDRDYRPDPETYLISMPLERNDGSDTSGVQRHGARWYFHLRLKAEDGRIYRCDCDGVDHEGLIPIEDMGYEQKAPEDREDFVPISELDLGGDDVQLAEVVDDRDRLKSGHEPLFDEVSQRVENQYRRDARDLFERVNDGGFETILELSTRERALFVQAFEDFGPGTDRPTARSITDAVADSLDLELDYDVAHTLADMQTTVDLCDRFVDRPDLEDGQTEATILDVERESGDGDVYMGVTINRAKCELAWRLDEDNQVVEVDSTDDYPAYETAYGWQRLKDLSVRSLREDYPQLDDEDIEAIESARDTSGSSGRQYDPEEKTVRIRRKTSRRSIKSKDVEEMVEEMADQGYIDVRYRNEVDSLLVFRQTEHGRNYCSEYCRNGVRRTVVPNYVADYLEGRSGFYTSVGEIKAEHDLHTVTCYDVGAYVEDSTVVREPDREHPPRPRQRRLGALGEETVIVATSEDSAESLRGFIEDEEYDLLGTIVDSMVRDVDSLDPDGIERVAITEADELDANFLSFIEADPDTGETYTSPVVLEPSSVYDLDQIDHHNWNVSDGDLIVDKLLPRDQFPRDSPEWELIANGAKSDLQSNTDKARQLIATLTDMADRIDDEPVFVSARDDADATTDDR